MSITLDFSQWEMGLRRLEKHLKALAVGGMQEASENLLKDAASEDPTIPFDTGALLGTGGNQGYVKGDSVYGAVWFGTPYAAYQHEGKRRDGSHVVKNYTTLGSGANFLRSKMLRNKNRYAKIVLRHMGRSA